MRSVQFSSRDPRRHQAAAAAVALVLSLLGSLVLAVAAPRAQASTATGGYWMVAADGGIFAFNAPFDGSMGAKPLNAPIVGMASTPDGGGYWMVARDGGIFAFGDAHFAGSMGAKPLNAPIVGMAAVGSATAPVAPGYDVSYPQCGSSLPSGGAFGIVGLNDGLANNLNPCLGPSSAYPSYTQSELYWSVASSTGQSSQPKSSLYLNTADPGNVYAGTQISDWPTSSSSADPYGSCTTTTVATTSGPATAGANSTACAWQYGYNKAAQDASWLTAAANAINSQSPPVTVAPDPGSYQWWLDVETVSTWQSGTSGQAMNVADLQGMMAGLQAAGVSGIGAYSTSQQWDQVTGGTTAASGSLYRIPVWLPGATTGTQAQANCAAQPSFTGGAVTVTQWTSTPADSDYAC
ncbi:MAG: hypothetical protein ACYCSJ_06945 [Acidimicrobiales bacterium]